MNQNTELWLNPGLQEIEPNEKINGYWFVYMQAANNRYMRFLPFTAQAFPETAAKKGIMESPLVPAENLKTAMNAAGARIPGNVYLKNDAALPVYGSTWARGGMNEVLQIAERIAQKAKMLSPAEKYGKVNSEEFRELYSRYTICVPKDDDPGRSALRMAEALGFRTAVGDAESAGDTVICIDPASSETACFGISSAAMRTRSQLRRWNIEVDKKHPLFVYIPCENGMIPSAITFGLKQLCLNSVHCFLVEKEGDPAVREFLIRQMAEADEEEEEDDSVKAEGETPVETEAETSVKAEGGTPVKAADRVSDFACDLMKYLISGAVSVDEETARTCAGMLADQENITLPAASCTGLAAVAEMWRSGADDKDHADGCGAVMDEYIDRHGLRDVMDQSTHIIWVTGGADPWN